MDRTTVETVGMKKKPEKESIHSARSLAHCKTNKTLTFREFRNDYMNLSITNPLKN